MYIKYYEWILFEKNILEMRTGKYFLYPKINC